MEPEAQRTLAAWAVIGLGIVGCGVAFALIDSVDSTAAALGWYALAVGSALAAGAVPVPNVRDVWRLRE